MCWCTITNHLLGGRNQVGNVDVLRVNVLADDGGRQDNKLVAENLGETAEVRE